MKTVNLPFTPADIKRNAIADHIWRLILNDDELARARGVLSLAELRRIVEHCLAADKEEADAPGQ